MFGDFLSLIRLPRVDINLNHAETVGNDPFYGRIVREFYETTRRRHPKFPLVKRYEYGVALCTIPKEFEAYFMMIEAAARRNFKKAERNGYVFSKIDFNNHLGDIKEIRQSTDVRQGSVASEILNGKVTRCSNPASTTNIHDYPYFGILKDGRLVAYAGCLVAGELCMIEHILGHAARQSDGIVPALIISIARYVMEHYPSVKYYGYGTYFGAGRTMRRFKRKFGFVPHRVKWTLGESRTESGGPRT